MLKTPNPRLYFKEKPATTSGGGGKPMTTRNFRGMLQCGVFLALFGASAASPALELGAPVARSGIGEPLEIDVPVSGEPEQLRALNVQRADWTTHVTGHPEPPSIPAGTTYSVNGSVIEIRSNTAVTEPYIGVALQLSTPNARIVRPVTVLLNPPDYRAAATTPHAVMARPPERRLGAPRRYGPVREGETLSLIARSLQTETGASIEQVMWALFDANPHAFEGGADGLKAGVHLTVLPAPMITAVEPQRATAELEAARLALADTGPVRRADQPASVPSVALNTIQTGAAPGAEAQLAADAPDVRPATHGGGPPPGDAQPVPGSTADALSTLTRRVSILDRHAEALRAQLAERDQEVTWLQDELRLRERPRGEPKALPTLGIEWIVLFLSIGGTVLFLFGMWIGGRRASAVHYAEPEWIPGPPSAFEQPDRLSVTAAPSTQSTVPLQPEDCAEAEDPLGPQDMDFKLQTRPFAKSDAIAFSETDPMDELEAYIAKGQYAQAKTLLGRLINLFPDETSFRLYLLKILYAGREDETFHEHALYLHARRERITDDLWQEVVKMGAALMPDEALYGTPRAAEPESEPTDPNRIIEFSAAKSALQPSCPIETMVPGEEQEEVNEFLSELRNNDNAP